MRTGCGVPSDPGGSGTPAIGVLGWESAVGLPALSEAGCPEFCCTKEAAAGRSSAVRVALAAAAGLGVCSFECIAIAEKVASKTVAAAKTEAEIERVLRDMCVHPETQMSG